MTTWIKFDKDNSKTFPKPNKCHDIYIFTLVAGRWEKEIQAIFAKDKFFSMQIEDITDKVTHWRIPEIDYKKQTHEPYAYRKFFFIPEYGPDNYRQDEVDPIFGEIDHQYLRAPEIGFFTEQLLKERYPHVNIMYYSNDQLAHILKEYFEMKDKKR